MLDTMTNPSHLNAPGNADGVVASLARNLETQSAGHAGNRRTKERHEYLKPVSLLPCDRNGVPRGEPVACESRDISLWGLRCVSPSHFESGTFVVITLPMRTAGKERTVKLLAQVRHVQPISDGVWEVGCEFRETLS